MPDAVGRPSRAVFRVDLRELGWDDPGALGDDPQGLPPLRADPRRRPRRIERARGGPRDAGASSPGTTCRISGPTGSSPRRRDRRSTHRILGLPNNAQDLERSLNVDFAANFRLDRIARAGFCHERRLRAEPPGGTARRRPRGLLEELRRLPPQQPEGDAREVPARGPTSPATSSRRTPSRPTAAS